MAMLKTVTKELKTEQVKSWLGLAVESGKDLRRPPLSWAHKETIHGRPAMVAADGYRLHLEWQQAEEFSEWLEFPDSEKLDDSARFPAVDALIPGSTDTTAMYTHDLTAAVKRAMVFGRDSANVITLSVKDNLYRVYGKSFERGDCMTEFECSSAYPIEIDLNGRHLLDALKGFVEEEQLLFCYTRPKNPFYFTDEGRCKRLALLMPMSNNR